MQSSSCSFVPHRTPLASGYYWIELDGFPIEIALWDSMVRAWLLVGTSDRIDEEWPATVRVLGGPLQPPVGATPPATPYRPMPDEPRIAGFYWISIEGQAPDVAYWDAEVRAWVLTGREDLTEEDGLNIVVIAGPPKPLEE